MKRLKLDKPENIMAALAIGYGVSLTRQSSRIKIGRVKLSMSVVNKWLENGAVAEFVFQFYTPNFKTDAPLQLVMYVMDDKGACLNPKDPELLEIKSKKKFDESAILGNNTLSRERLLSELKDPSGDSKKYDYLLFTPRIDEAYHHIIYDFDPYFNGKKLPTFSANNHTNPCPPGC